MTKKNNKKKYLTIASVLLAVLLIAALVIGLSSAKYKTEKRLTGDVKFTAKLADKILLQEHEAEAQPDGSYMLTDNIVYSQSYTLMPGVDVPKDPFITIEGKTAIPAYLYVEVCEGENFPEKVSYKLTSDWEPLTKTVAVSEGSSETTTVPVTGLHEGKIYVYKYVITNENAQTADGLVEFQILDHVPGSDTDTLEVSAALPRGTTATLNFYAYICQKYTDDKVANFSIHETAEQTLGETQDQAGTDGGVSNGGN